MGWGVEGRSFGGRSGRGGGDVGGGGWVSLALGLLRSLFARERGGVGSGIEARTLGLE